MNFSDDAKKIIQESEYKQALEVTIAFTRQLLQEAEIHPTELQWTILINHLNEMIKREQQQEAIAAVDATMFAEISTEALEIAGKVVQQVGNLPEDEMYVLSIHFESAKTN